MALLKQTRIALASLIAACSFAACLVDDRNGDDDAETTGDVDSYLKSLDHLEIPPASPKTEIECAENCPEAADEGGYFCSYKRFTETVRFDRFVALQPNSATLWPGAVVHGYDAQFGHLNPLSAKLAPSTFSISLENIAASPVGHMAEPSLSSFREVRNDMLAAGVTGATAAAIDFEVIQVHSESQAAVALGAGADWPGAGAITGSFNFSSWEKRTKVLVNFTQAYYTVDIDTPTKPSGFFDKSVTVEDLAGQTSNDDPPLYVQSITFGRRVLFSIESIEDAETITAALEAAMSKAVNAEIEVSVDHKDVLQQSTIRAFVIGGSGGSATGIVNGFEGLVAFIEAGGDYSKESPGAPIAYKLAYLDNTSAQLAFTSEYNERSCERTTASLRIELLGMDHISGDEIGGNIEIYGDVTVRLPTAESNVAGNCLSGGVEVPLWSLPDGSWIEFPKYGSWSPTSPIYLFREDVPIEDGKRLCLFGDLWEEDFSTGELSGDDDFGVGLLSILAQEGWEGEHTIQVRGSSNRAIDVHVSIQVK